MSTTTENNKRIAKNTLMLYIRMLFSMLVSLYTSRVILQTLGVEDYGIYNVVGGVVSMFSIFNGGINSSTLRYLTFEIEKKNPNQLNKVFSNSILIHTTIAIIIIILGETIGLWFLNEKLTIPDNRITAAFWVYQCSIMSCVINIISAPYHACVIAHEKMTTFAYISIFEVILKLLIVYILYIIPWDKLSTYAFLFLCMQLTIPVIYIKYCKKNFKETYYHHYQIEKSLFKEMFSFASWCLWGNIAFMLYTQGLNIILNIFYGPVINAARGIAVQIQNITHQFVNNFQTAINPQITKYYATNNLNQMHNLMFCSARFSFYLLFFITLPVLLETDYLLSIWLKNTPNDSAIFAKWMIGISLLNTISNPCLVANQATGRIKKYQIVVSSILIMILPISYIALKLGYPPYSVFIVHFIIELLAQFVRIFMLEKLIDLSIKTFLHRIYTPIFMVIVFSSPIPIIVHNQLPIGLFRFLIVGIVCVISVGTTILFIGLTKEERYLLFHKARYHLGFINIKK